MSAGNFYRPKNVQKHLRSLAKQAARNKRRTVLVVFAIIGLLYVLFDNKGIIARIGLESRKAEMLGNIAAAEDSTARLKAHVEALQKDEKTIETVAREKYGMTRAGEKLYRVEKEKKE